MNRTTERAGPPVTADREPAKQIATGRGVDGDEQRWRELIEVALSAVLVVLVVGVYLNVLEPPSQPTVSPSPPTAELARLPRGMWIDGVLGADGRGTWRIEDVSDQLVIVEARSNAFSTALELRVPSGETVVGRADPEARYSYLQTWLAAGELYVVDVTSPPDSPFFGGRIGNSGDSYRVRVRRIMPSALAWGEWVQAELGGPEERHGVWRVEGASGQAIVVEAGSTQVDTGLRLLSATGEEMARNDDIIRNGENFDSRLVTMLPADGQYLVEVTAVPNSERGLEGGYDVRAREVVPQNLDFNRSVGAELDDGDEGYGIWQIEGTAGQIVALEARSSVFHTGLALLSGTGELIARDDDVNRDSNGARLQTRLSSDGRYWVEVAALGDEREGAYTVEAREVAVVGGS